MATTNWHLDPSHSEVTFTVRHLMFATVSGRFESFKSSASMEDQDITSAQATFEIETASINTGVAQRDGHLRSDDFFNAEQFPTITFTSKAVRSKGDNNYEVEGSLKIRDIEKDVTFDVELGGIAKDPWGNTRVAVEASGKISRKEFQLRWNELTEAGPIVSDDVKFKVNAQYVLAPVEQPA